MLAVLFLRVYRLGNRVVVQKNGVPIGGPLSSSLFRLVVAACEYRLDHQRWDQLCSEFNLRGTRKSHLALVRHEDDVLACSLIRTCENPEHSCFRCVVSFAAFQVERR